MASSGATKSQLSYIEKLCSDNPSRKKMLQNFLKDQEVTDVSELTVRDASIIIEKLKKLEESNKGSRNDMSISGKQLQLIDKLQDSEPRKAETARYLRENHVASVGELSLNQASALIDALLKLPRGKPSESPVSRKQIRFIQSLLKTGDNESISKSFLRDVRKKIIEELTSKEASELIDMLKK